MNKQGFRTLLLSFKNKYKKIINVYRKLVSKFPKFQISVLNMSPEDSKLINKEYYEDNEWFYFNKFIWSNFLFSSYEAGFTAVILDENKNLVYNRELEFESEDDYELREYIKSDLKVNPKEIEITKRVYRCSDWNLCDDTEVKTVLYQIDDNFSFKSIAKFTKEFS